MTCVTCLPGNKQTDDTASSFYNPQFSLTSNPRVTRYTSNKKKRRKKNDDAIDAIDKGARSSGYSDVTGVGLRKKSCNRCEPISSFRCFISRPRVVSSHTWT